MKPLTTLLLLAVVSLLSLKTQGETDPAPKTKTFFDFSKKAPTYGYEGWADLGSVSKKNNKGIIVEGPASGGFGLFLDPEQDFSQVAKLHFILIRNRNHSEEKLLVKLHDTNGVSASWFLSLDKVKDNKEESSVVVNLSKADEGQVESLDLSKIKQIQIQGSFSPGKTVDLLFISIDTEAKPKS